MTQPVKMSIHKLEAGDVLVSNDGRQQKITGFSDGSMVPGTRIHFEDGGFALFRDEAILDIIPGRERPPWQDKTIKVASGHGGLGYIEVFKRSGNVVARMNFFDSDRPREVEEMRGYHDALGEAIRVMEEGG